MDRPKQYGGVEGEKEAPIDMADDQSKKSTEESKEGSSATSATLDDGLKRLKMVSGDLLDLWLFEGSKGLKYIQESKAYKMTDPYIDYIGQYENVKSKGSKIVEKIGELN